MQVIIGIGPHQATHTAVAVDGSEDELAWPQGRATRAQVEELLTWAAPFPSRTWAIEGAEGLAFLLAQQPVTAGETVVDVPATTRTVPVEFSSGGRIAHRLSRRLNRSLDSAIHMAAVAQLRHEHSAGRIYLERKVAEGTTNAEH